MKLFTFILIFPLSTLAQVTAPDWLHFRPGVMHQQGCLVCAKKGTRQVPDADGDGMADDFEKKYQLNPNSAADAALDADKDGFTNLEEHTSRTDPTDPENHPAWWTRLRVIDLEMEPLELRLLALNQKGPPVMLRINQQMHAGGIGDRFAGVAIAGLTAQGVTCRVNRETVEVFLDEPVFLEQPRVHLSFGDEVVQVYPEGDRLELNGSVYTTHQLSRDGLLIREEGVRSNISFLVPTRSAEALTKINDLLK